MKIKINDWTFFEKLNGIFFTRDNNIKNELDVYAIAHIKKKKHYLVHLDFISHKLLMFIVDENITILDDYNPLDLSFMIKFESETTDIDTNNKVHLILENVIAPKWMFDNTSFFADIFENQNRALDDFKKHNR